MWEAIKKAWTERRISFEINLGEILFLAAFLYWLCTKH